MGSVFSDRLQLQKDRKSCFYLKTRLRKCSIYVGWRKQGQALEINERRKKGCRIFYWIFKNLQKFRIHAFRLTLKHMYISCKAHSEGTKWQEHTLKKNHHPICIFINSALNVALHPWTSGLLLKGDDQIGNRHTLFCE